MTVTLMCVFVCLRPHARLVSADLCGLSVCTWCVQEFQVGANWLHNVVYRNRRTNLTETRAYQQAKAKIVTGKQE